MARRATQDDIEELAELWGVEEDDVRDLARQWRVPILELEAEAERRANVASERELAEEDEAEESEPEDTGLELDDDEVSDYAELWGVNEEDVEALAEELDAAPDEMTREELTEYVDDLYDALVDEGWELDVSDLWDMYYGYEPGSHGR